MTIHCTPVLDRPSSRWIWGTAMDTIVWSMKIIATAKIIAARTTPFDRMPVALLTVMTPRIWPVPVLTAWANGDVSLPYADVSGQGRRLAAPAERPQKSRADRDFTTAGCGADEQDIRHICTREEQHETSQN